MKGGKTPIHLWGRWSPADFLDDEVVRLVAARGDTRALAVYAMVLNASHRRGGELPADREELAAVLGMPRKIVDAGLGIWLKRGKLVEERGHLFHRRVRREVLDELRYRRTQGKLGSEGGRKRALSGKRKDDGTFAPGVAQGSVQGSSKGATKGDPDPPSPAPSPSPAPAPPTNIPPHTPPNGGGFELPPGLDEPPGRRLEALRLRAIEMGLHPDRKDLRQLRDWLKAGFTPDQIARTLEGVREQGITIAAAARLRM